MKIPGDSGSPSLHLPATTLIPRICGGLGNQLFIYAGARALAERRGWRLELDTWSGFERDTLYHRDLLLQKFAITAGFASMSDCFPGKFGWFREWLLKRMTDRGIAARRWRFLAEQSVDQLTPARKIYFRGYWQSESFFEDFIGIIRNEYAPFDALLPATSEELHHIIREPEAVGLCIRTFREVPSGHGANVIAEEFYRQAIKELSKTLRAPKIFIFTDDLAWVRSTYCSLAAYAAVAPKTTHAGAYEELALLRACRYFIIGNGTLHWWGAWLSGAPEKRVLVPNDVATWKPRFYPAAWQRI